jgi:adenylate cyclase
MRLPTRIHTQHPARKFAAGAVVALLATGLTVAARHVPGLSIAVQKGDWVFYDTMYRLRRVTDRTNGPVAIVAVDQKSLDLINAMNNGDGFGWPWPREFWGHLVTYFEKCGAKAVAFDIVFSEKSVYRNELDDDTSFGKAVNEAKVPVVFGTYIKPDGTPNNFAPKVEKPRFGAVNIGTDEVYRTYPPTVNGKPSLAVQTLRAAGLPVVGDASPLLLHYYGPHRSSAGKPTFRYVSAGHAIAAALGEDAKVTGVDAGWFKDKIVILGPITVGTFDLKATPLEAQYPGVEIQATAIENLLAGQRVHQLGLMQTAGAALLASLVAAVGVLVPSRVSLKVIGAACALIILLCVAIWLFGGTTITWMPLAVPLLALVLSTGGALAWSYVTEDRARRVVLKALSQYVSPAVAEQIAKDPSRLALGGERREMTVMFTDIQGFTNLTETMDVESLGNMLNFYLDEMSSVVLDNDGTLDKYIGDAIMSFWNAPIDQPDHAVRAARAALGMKRREEMIRPQLAKLGATGMLTRLGLNSGPMAVGNMGSTRKFNYTVLGDSVNLASRLEGANKFYGTQILMAETTAKRLDGRFAMRQIDVLRVKGKQQPMAVYELLAEGAAEGSDRARVAKYEAALAHYRAMRWDDAQRELEELKREVGEDAPSDMLLSRITKFRQHPPPAGWDGVYDAKEK